MTKKNKKTKSKTGFIVAGVILFLLIIIGNLDIHISHNYSGVLKILSSYENADLESYIEAYAHKNKITVSFTYMGDLEIVDELNSNSKSYDAVWISNSMWLYMLDNPYLASDSKSISISPVVFGIKNKRAEELNLKTGNVTTTDILNLISDKKLKYIMPSVTKTNTGATAYIGFLNSLAGNPEVLTEETLDDESLTQKLTNLFSGVERVSGDEDFLKTMFLNNDSYEAVIADEASLININKELQLEKKEELYLVYPTDGVAVNDSTLGFINNDPEKEEEFLKIQSYLLSDEGQTMLKDVGRRTWYGGVSKNVDTKTFNPKWGIDTSKYLNVTKFPSKKVITKALNIYIEKLRKPTHVVFCLDYSGSMYGEGIGELTNAMSYILDYNEASVDRLQFSDFDKITIVTFSSEVKNIFSTDNGHQTDEILSQIKSERLNGTTALYDAIRVALDILNKESDNYTKTIIAMTDGGVNEGSFYDLQKYYESLNKEIPVYSITFGSAVESQLNEIADLTNGKVFDGKTDLLKAFKEVRGYN